MVRHRIPSSSAGDGRGGHDRDPRGLHKKSKKNANSGNTLIFLVKLCCILVAVGVAAYFAYQGYLQTRVHTPLSLPHAVDKSGLQVPERYWGSYRPGVYFGLKTRSPADLLFGLMWMIPDKIKPNDLGLRHWCEQGDNLDTYGWLQHDGRSFGVQEIQDRGLTISTSFLKNLESDKSGGQWSARITVDKSSAKSKTKSVTLFLYAGMDEKSSDFTLRPILSEGQNSEMTGIVGKTSSLDDFRLNFFSENGVTQSFYSLIDTPGPQKFTESVMQRLRLFQMGSKRIIGLDSEHLRSSDPNLIVYQVNAELPFKIDITFNPSKEHADPPLAESYTKALELKQRDFNNQFVQSFGLQSFNDDQIRFAQAAMSNMIGGIGYFYGHSLVQSKYQDYPVRYWDGPLFTAVPSRSFFPRGFLWDEGFHNLLISKWDKRLSADIIAHWLDMMNVEGKIIYNSPKKNIFLAEFRNVQGGDLKLSVNFKPA